MADPPILAYYSDRADEYDEIYEIPELQSCLSRLERHVEETVSGHDVLEIACGTGHWTNVMATAAESVVASDAGTAVLGVAKSKLGSADNVELVQSDAYNPPVASDTFSAGFAGDWWSHVPKERLHEFLEAFHSKLNEGARICFIDTGSVIRNEELRIDETGNRYERRTLNDGRQYSVLKNFPTENQLRETISEYGSEIEYYDFDYFWCLSYRLA